MPTKPLYVLICLLTALVLHAKPGIKSIVVFGDSLSDAGNSAIWAETYTNLTNPDLIGDPALIPVFPLPYYDNRASNGPVWIEIAAQAYGYGSYVAPSLEGGMNFAFSGAESGNGFSDQFTPNFHSQIRMYRQALQNETIEPPMPWQLFVVWFGPNDINRALAEVEQPIDPAVFVPRLAGAIASNVAEGIVSLHELGARMFLVPNLPPVELTPSGASQPEEVQGLLTGISRAYNQALNQALDRIEAAYKKVTILRLDVNGAYTSIVAMPSAFGFGNVTEPAFSLTEDGLVWNWDPDDLENFNPNSFLSWDGFHPTVAGHALLAQKAMDIIPIGSWWGHSMANGPDGNTATGGGWVNDSHWPWFYSYNMDGGTWMWARMADGSPEGFMAYIPTGYKWVFVNMMSGWYYDYETASWKQL